MNDFDSDSLNKRLPLLRNGSKYSSGLPSPVSQRFTFTGEQIEALGQNEIIAQNARIDRREGFEWVINTFNMLKNETISDHGSYSTPKNLEEYLRLLSTSSIGQISNTIEDAEAEIDATKEIAEMLNESVFADDIKRDMEATGVAYIRHKRLGNVSSELVRGEDAYNNLAALTKEKLQLLKVVAELFAKVKEMYEKELALRQAQTPNQIKTLTQNLKNLVTDGCKKKKELEKAALKYTANKTPANRVALEQLWNEFAAIESQYTNVRDQLFKVSPQTKVPEPPVLSHEAWVAKGFF